MTNSTVDSFAVTTQLRYELGLVGYAVYVRLCELCASAPSRRLAFDAKAIAWDLRTEEETVEKVVKGFGLFVIGEDGFIEDVNNKSELAKIAEKKAEISAKRSLAGKKGALARAAKKAAQTEASSVTNNQTENVRKKEVKEEVAPVLNINGDPIESSGGMFDPEIVEIHDKLEQVKAEWNRIFGETRRKVNWMFCPPTVHQDFVESLKYHPVQDFIDAFEEAFEDKKFSWTFGAAIREKNVTMLIGRADLKKEQKTEKEEEMPLEKRELLEYVKQQGIDW